MEDKNQNMKISNMLSLLLSSSLLTITTGEDETSTRQLLRGECELTFEDGIRIMRVASYPTETAKAAQSAPVEF